MEKENCFTHRLVLFIMKELLKIICHMHQMPRSTTRQGTLFLLVLRSTVKEKEWERFTMIMVN